MDVAEQAPQSRFKGVYYVLGGRWESKITFQSKTRHIGTFDTELEAAFAFDAKAHQLGVPHRANFIYDAEGNVVSTQVVESLRGLKRGRQTAAEKVKAAAAIADLDENNRGDPEPAMVMQRQPVAYMPDERQRYQPAPMPPYHYQGGPVAGGPQWQWGHPPPQERYRYDERHWDYPPKYPMVVMMAPQQQQGQHALPPAQKRLRRGAAGPNDTAAFQQQQQRKGWGGSPVLWDAAEGRPGPPHYPPPWHGPPGYYAEQDPRWMQHQQGWLQHPQRAYEPRRPFRGPRPNEEEEIAAPVLGGVGNHSNKKKKNPSSSKPGLYSASSLSRGALDEAKKVESAVAVSAELLEEEMAGKDDEKNSTGTVPVVEVDEVDDEDEDHPTIAASRYRLQYSGPDYYEPRKGTKNVADLLSAAANSSPRSYKILERPSSFEEDADDDTDGPRSSPTRKPNGDL